MRELGIQGAGLAPEAKGSITSAFAHPYEAGRTPTPESPSPTVADRSTSTPARKPATEWGVPLRRSQTAATSHRGGRSAETTRQLAILVAGTNGQRNPR